VWNDNIKTDLGVRECECVLDSARNNKYCLAFVNTEMDTCLLTHRICRPRESNFIDIQAT
jgi:hypothetical protein